jgi:putative salt-induced outer membrane protein
MSTSRESGPLGEDVSEAIVGVSTDYTGDLSDSARLIQSIGVDIGEQTTIGRSETAVESDIMSNLSMKFGVKIKHQT